MSIQSKIQNNYPLKNLTTFKIGGDAQYFIEVSTKEEIEQTWAWAKSNHLAITLLGGASNVLISDEGIKGLVVKLNNPKLLLEETEITCGASVAVWDVSRFAADNSLSGLEWAIGIPGSIGGAIRGNAGAHGGSFDKIISKVMAFDSVKGEWLELTNEGTHFSYRQSLFKEQPHFIIWQATLKLVLSDKKTIDETISNYKKYREDLQPKEPSAGCVFKNFFLADIAKVNPDLAKKLEADGKVRAGKVGAGYIIELLGLKGFSYGGAKISPQHANFIVNFDKATSGDVLMIIEEVKREAKNKLNIDFIEEVQLLGF
jgi:UDP-N-acetylmuramate dehydrogenase